MWKIRHIFDGDYGCEGLLPGQSPRVSVTLVDEERNERYVSVENAWMTEQGLDVGDNWPCEMKNRALTLAQIRKIENRNTVAKNQKWRAYTNEHTDFWYKKCSDTRKAERFLRSAASNTSLLI